MVAINPKNVIVDSPVGTPNTVEQILAQRLGTNPFVAPFAVGARFRRQAAEAQNSRGASLNNLLRQRLVAALLQQDTAKQRSTDLVGNLDKLASVVGSPEAARMIGAQPTGFSSLTDAFKLNSSRANTTNLLGSAVDSAQQAGQTFDINQDVQNLAGFTSTPSVPTSVQKANAAAQGVTVSGPLGNSGSSFKADVSATNPAVLAAMAKAGITDGADPQAGALNKALDDASGPKIVGADGADDLTIANTDAQIRSVNATIKSLRSRLGLEGDKIVVKRANNNTLAIFSGNPPSKQFELLRIVDVQGGTVNP